MTQIAVIILNYNGQEFLKKFLPSVIEYSDQASIVVADNCSTDDSISLLKNSFSSVEVIEIHENLGFSGGYNYALKQVTADYFVLLNSDVEVTKNWLAPMKSMLESNPQVGAVQPKILSYSNRNTFDYAGAGGGYIDKLGYPFCRGRIFNEIENDNGQYDDEVSVFWSSGACMMIRSKVYAELQGLDEDFFAHMEEIDLCWRILRKGYNIKYTGMSVVYHVGGGTLSSTNPRKTYFNFRNGLSLIVKHLPPTEIFWKLLVRLFLDWIAAIKFLMDGSFLHSGAVFKAHFHWMIQLKRDFHKRSELSKTLPFIKEPMYNKSIVWDFFVRKKKEFQKLDF